jgi:hypothetical protein
LLAQGERGTSKLHDLQQARAAHPQIDEIGLTGRPEARGCRDAGAEDHVCPECHCILVCGCHETF